MRETMGRKKFFEYSKQLGVLAIGLFFLASADASDPAPAPTKACRIEGMPNELQCGIVVRPLDPLKPNGTKIDVHFLVVPAMARNKQTDAVLLLAGGPGQSAIALARAVLPRLARLSNRRDLVFIDQRGTGKSAPLQCPDDSKLPVAQVLDTAKQLQRLNACREDLAKLPYGDLRFYSTSIAMQDFEAVRQLIGAPQWNLVGASYGTRAALEYMRQYPDKVRRTILDGVAPPDMVLPASFSTDGQAALEAVFKACEAEADCSKRFPQLRKKWAALLQSLPRTVSVNHPATGLPERFTLTRDVVLRSVRSPLYMPAIAAALPAAIDAAAEGRYEGLTGLASALGSSKATRLAMGMHFSVVCAEDVPRMANGPDKPGEDFGSVDGLMYQNVCAGWPLAEIPPAFYTVPPAISPVLMLSGGADPVTPPRHGARVAAALGAKAQHIVVAQAGHGVMSIGCMRDVVFRFIDAKTDAEALPQNADCATKIPRPGVFVPVQPNQVSAEEKS